MLSLTIHHNIHLTREERYNLHAGQEIVTVGVSVPVWFFQRMTSEPAKEIFCKYFIGNPKKDDPIRVLENGYSIPLPYREGVRLDIPNEEWWELYRKDPKRLEELEKVCVEEVSSKSLLDLKDGGCGHLSYREHNKIQKEDKTYSIMHYVSINAMEQLVNSIEPIKG
jgi:hypothetical protein